MYNWDTAVYVHGGYEDTVWYATTNECYDKQFFINKIRMPQWTQMLQWRRRNTISQC